MRAACGLKADNAKEKHKKIYKNIKNIWGASEEAAA